MMWSVLCADLWPRMRLALQRSKIPGGFLAGLGVAYVPVLTEWKIPTKTLWKAILQTLRDSINPCFWGGEPILYRLQLCQCLCSSFNEAELQYKWVVSIFMESCAELRSPGIQHIIVCCPELLVYFTRKLACPPSIDYC